MEGSLEDFYKNSMNRSPEEMAEIEDLFNLCAFQDYLIDFEKKNPNIFANNPVMKKIIEMPANELAWRLGIAKTKKIEDIEPIPICQEN
jgi:hypothetical protein